MPRLMLVTEPRYGLQATRDLIHSLSEAYGSRFVVQLRDRADAWSFDDKVLLAQRAKVHSAYVWVNRDVGLARAVQADGMHAELMELGFAVRSAPVHTEAERIAAMAAGANALVVSPVFEVPAKGPPCGLGFLKTVVASSPQCQVWALGGIHMQHARDCIAVGAVGVAMQRALYEAKDPVGLVAGLW